MTDPTPQPTPSTDLAKIPQPPAGTAVVEIAPKTGQVIRLGFETVAGFEAMQRAAKLLASSSLVPTQYQNNIPNAVIALNMALRLGADPLMVAQNLYVVHGRPGWSSQFLIATFNQCGRFSSLRYRFSGDKGKDSWGCVAYAKELSTGDMLEGTEITIGMAKAEGWHGKNGSKWQTMPEQMLRYRAAGFFIRAIAPELAMGLQTAEEIEDVGEPAFLAPPPPGNGATALQAALPAAVTGLPVPATPADAAPAGSIDAAQQELQQLAKAQQETKAP